MPDRLFSKSSAQNILLPEIQEMDISQVSALSGMSPQTPMDWIFCGLIIAGLLLIFYGSFVGEVFQPLLMPSRRLIGQKLSFVQVFYGDS